MDEQAEFETEAPTQPEVSESMAQTLERLRSGERRPSVRMAQVPSPLDDDE